MGSDIESGRTAEKARYVRIHSDELGESRFDDLVSSRGESHPSALSELCMTLSAHTAPIVQPSGRTPSRQCANSFGSRLATLTSHRLARRSWRCNRLYFRLAHRTRYSLMRLSSG